MLRYVRSVSPSIMPLQVKVCVTMDVSRISRLVAPVVAGMALLFASAGTVGAEGWWAQTIRPAEFWSGPDATARLFGQLPRGTYVLVENADADTGTTRLFAREAGEQNFGYIEAVTLNPTDAPPGEAGSSPASGAFRPFWAATLEVTELSNGRKNGSEVVATLPQFATVLVLGEPGDGTYYVQDARTARVGNVDGSKVGPSFAPTPEDEVIWSSPAFANIPDGHRPWWVEATRASNLWSAATGGASFGPVKVGDRFIVMEPQSGTRLTIFNPVTRNFAYVDLDAVKKAGAPKAVTVEVGGWVGIVAGERANLRQEPHTVMAAAGQVIRGDEVTVSSWVEGEELEGDNRTWARVMGVRRKASDGTWVDLPLGDISPERFVYSGLLVPKAVTEAPVPPTMSLGQNGAKWIDVNITQQVVVAYEGVTRVYMAAVTSGRPGWSTPLGVFKVLRRVENETMLGSTLLRLDSGEVPDYKLENVKWTQYFTNGGAALHTNYWRSPVLFGMPSSHGCLGMIERHAKWLWDWANIGTPINIHI